MEKQGLRFFILHALARQLQSWADFIFQQIEGGFAHQTLSGGQVSPDGVSVQRRQAKVDGTDMGSAADASRAAFSPLPTAPTPAPEEAVESMDAEWTDTPPAHWLARLATSDPPAHWLARVQKDAPEQLTQREHFSMLPTGQAAGYPQMADSGQRARMAEVMRSEKDSSTLPEIGGYHREERARQDETASNRQARIGDYLRRRDEVHKSRFFVAMGLSEQEELNGRPQESPPPSTSLHSEQHARQARGDVPRSGEDGDVAGKAAWEADDGPWRSAHPSIGPRSMERTQKPPRMREGEARQHETTSSRRTESIRIETASGRSAQAGTYRVEEGWTRQTKTDVSASPNSAAKRNVAQRRGQGKELLRASEPDVHPISLLQRPEVKQDFPSWEERRARHTIQPSRHNLLVEWSQANGVAAPVHDHQSLDRTSEQIPIAMRWPSLPDEVTTSSQDGEIMLRAWQRQQRLDEEQRGCSWNA
jgi:hypothetical protein